MNTKKIIIVSGIVIGIIALGIGMYFAWQKSGEDPADALLGVTPGVTSTVIGQDSQLNGQNSAASKSIRILSKNKALDYWIFTDNSTSTASAKNVFYISSDGNIWAIKGNSEQLVNNTQAKDIQSVKASADGNIIAIKSGTFAAPKFDILNLKTNIWQPAMIGISAVSWSPNGERLAYLQNGGKGESELFIKDFSDSKSKVQKIISLTQTDFDLDWYGDNNVLLVPKPSIVSFSEIWNINIKTQTVSKLTSGNSLMVKWLKFGNLGLKFSSNTGRNYVFSLIDDRDNLKGSFKFVTLPNKCLLSSSTQIYCAIPRDQSIFSAYNFPDDYLKKGVYAKDGIYAIDLMKNQIVSLFETDSPVIDAINLSVMENQLLFISRYDQKLYSLPL